MSKLQLSFDATALRESACMLDFHRVVVEGLREPVLNADMIYGMAVHKYVEQMYKSGGHIPTARNEAAKVFNVPKTTKPKKQHMADWIHCSTTCFMYWDTYITQDNNFDVIMLNDKPAAEVNFEIPFYEDDICVIKIFGTIDRIGKIRNGIYAIGDHKSTSSWDEDSYLDSYAMSLQLRMYRLALILMGRYYPDTVLGKIGNSKVGAFIDGLFIKSKANENVYSRSEVFQFSDEDMKEFEANLQAKCRELSNTIQLVQAGKKIPRQGIVNNVCEKKYGLCKFWNVCKSTQPEVQQLLLKRDFVSKPYDLEHFGER